MKRKSLFFILLFALTLTLVGCFAPSSAELNFKLSSDEVLVGYDESKAVLGTPLNSVLKDVTVTKEGYTHTGWELEGYGPIVDDSDLMMAGSTVIPTFTANEYQVTLDPNDGNQATTQTVVYDQKADLEMPESKDPYKVFDKWYLDSELTNPWDGKVQANDFTLYASYRYINDSMLVFYYDNQILFEYAYNEGDTIDVSKIANDFYQDDYSKPELLKLEWYTEDGKWVNENYQPTEYVEKVFANIYTDNLRYAVLKDADGNETDEVRVLSVDVYNSLDPETGEKIPVKYDELYIGKYIEGYKVTEVGKIAGYSIPSSSYNSTEDQKAAYAKSINAVLKKVYIPNTVKTIASGAFSYCETLSEVVFEDNSNLETILDSAFIGCISLETIDLPESLKHIGPASYIVNDKASGYKNYDVDTGAFALCTSLKNINFPEQLETISHFSFYNCMSLETVVLPQNLKTLSVGAFYNAFTEEEGVTTSLTIYGSDNLFYQQNFLTGEGEYYSNHSNPLYYCNVNEVYFYGVTKLPGVTNVKIGSTATTNNVLSVTKPSDMLLFGNVADDEIAYPFFFGCERLSKVSFDNAIEEIGSYAFFELNNLELSIPADVEEVKYGEGVFAKVTFGGEFRLPDNMYDIPDYAFAGSDLTKFSNTTPMYETIGEFAFMDCENLEEFKITSYVEYIASTAFKDCVKLANENAFILDNDGFSFYEDQGVKTLLVGNQGTTILYDFATDVAVKTFPEGITTIPALYTSNKTITTLYIPSTVKVIEAEAFSGCTSLTTIIFAQNSQLESIGAGAFKTCSKLVSAYYEGTTETDVFMIPKSVKTIGCTVEELNEYRKSETYAKDYLEGSYSNGAFYNAGVSNIVFEDGTAIEFIGAGSFYRITGTALESVTFPENAVTEGLEICKNAFTTKSNSKGVFGIPAYATYLGKDMCKNWANVTFPETAKFTDLGGALTGVVGTSNSVVIPAYIETLPDDAFSGTKLKNISFAEGSKLKSIGILSSTTASTITKLDFTNCLNVESIANECFKKVTVTELVLNSNMLVDGVIKAEEDDALSFGGSSFGATGLKVTINESLANGSPVEYSVSTLFTSSKLATIDFAEGLVSVGKEGFKGTKLVTVEFPATLESLGEYVFSSCTSLTTVKFNSEVELNEGTFFKCTKLVNFTLPEGFKSVPNAMFYGCISLKTVNLPDSVESIGNFAFTGCKVLATINTNNTLPTNLTKIGDKAFYQCQALAGKTINFPASLEEIGVLAFNLSGSADAKKVYSAKLVFTNEGGVNGLKLGQYALENCEFADENGFSIYTTSYTTDTTSFSNVDYNKEYSYKDYVETVLTYYSSDAEAVVPEGVTMIDDGAFTGSKTTSIVLPSSLKEIAKGTSSYPTMKTSDNKLSSVVFKEGRSADSTLAIMAYAFYDMPLATLTLPTTGKVEINTFAFAAKNAASTNKMVELDLYLPGNVTFVGSSTFRYQSNLKSVTFGEGITKLESQMFDIDSCVNGLTYSGITSITLPSTLEVVSSKTFYNWGALKEVNFTPKADGTYALTTFGSNWLGGSLVESILIPESVTEIVSSAFAGMSRLNKVELPESITEIGNGAFKNTAITELVIPASVETLQSSMVEGCSELTKIVIGTPEKGTSLTEIPSKAFTKATSLTTVLIYSDSMLTHKGTSASNGAFYQSGSNVVVYVSANLLAEYTANKNWGYANCKFEDLSKYSA